MTNADAVPGGRLVGRARELAQASAVVDAALAGAGGLLLLTGEAGIGKTRLVEALAARTPARLLSGLCWDTAGIAPFWPWSAVLRECAVALDLPHGRELAPVLGVEHERAAGPADQLQLRLYGAVASYLADASRREPLLIVLEDLHAADQASLDLLRYVVTELRGRPVALVATYRHPDLRFGAAQAKLAELGRVGHTVSLRELDDDAVASLIEQTFGAVVSETLVAAVRDRAGGNPLFVTELARLLATRGDLRVDEVSVPPNVQQVIGGRLAQLERPLVDLLALASVQGQRFDRTVLEKVMDQPPGRLADLLDAAVSAGLVTLDSPVGAGKFTHALVRDVLYASLPAADRRTAHLRVATAIENSSDSLDEHLDAVADHLLSALPDGDPKRVLKVCREAGSRSLRLLAYDDAARRFSDAAELGARAGVDEAGRIELLLALGDAWLRAGNIDAATVVFDSAAASAQRRGRPDELARAALGYGAGLSGIEVRLFNHHQVDLLREALDALNDDEPVLRAWVLARLSVAESYVASREHRLAYSQEAVALSRQSGDAKLRAYALSSLCDALPGPEHNEERLELATTMVRLSIDARDPESELLGRRLRLVALLERGDMVGVDAEAAAFERTAARMRWPLVTWYPPVWRGMRALIEGRLDDAKRLAMNARDIGRRGGSGNAELAADSQVLRIAIEQGRLDDAFAQCEPFLTDPEGGPNAESFLVMLLARMGRHAEARGLLQRLAAADFPLHRDAVWMETIGAVAEGCAILDDAAVAERLLPLLEPFADRFATGTSVGALCLGSMSLPIGLLASCLERWDDADAYFGRALTAHRQAGASLLVAHTLREQAGMVARRSGRGDTERAAALRAEADDLYRQLGLDLWVSAPATLARAVGSGERAKRTDTQINVFRQDGDVRWVRYDGQDVRLRDTLGFATLARLLAEPGRELHVFDLLSEDPHDERFATGRDTGEVIDAQARQAYKRRLEELEAEVDAAHLAGDMARTERAQAERDALVEQLTAAYGLGGRARRGNDPVERARSTVTKRLRGAVSRIRTAHPALARHLDNALSTGRYCRYDPEPPTSWQT